MNDLARILEGYCQAYDDLRTVARSKREVLLAGRAQELEPLVQAEEALLACLGRLDRELEAARAAMAGDETPEGGVTLPELLDRLPPEERQELETLGARLEASLAELRVIGEENVRLLRQALEFVQFSINLLERSAHGVTYGASGRVASGRGPMVDRRA